MKKIYFILALFSATSLALFLPSCSDPCKDVVCQNGGTCDDGNCDCADGYSGSNCSTADSEAFVGSYNVAESCGFGNDSYAITIVQASANAAMVIIDNLYAWGEPLNATINGNQLTIASQDADGIIFSGSGTLDGNILTINFDVMDSVDMDTCTAVCTMQ